MATGRRGAWLGANAITPTFDKILPLFPSDDSVPGGVLLGDIVGAVIVRARGSGLDDAANIQAAINDNPFGHIHLPDLTYVSSGITISADQSPRITGSGKTNINSLNNDTVLLWVKKHINRGQTFSLDGINFHGLDKPGVVGLRVGEISASGEISGARLNANISNCLIQRCAVGLEVPESMECSFNNVMAFTNEIGLKVISGSVNGGGNALLFENCNFQGNDIGVVLIKGHATFPMHHIKFVGGTIQASKTCGLANFGATDIVLDGVHIETNGVDTSPASITVEGKSVLRSPILCDGGTLALRNMYAGEVSLPFVKLLNGARLSIKSMTGFGSQTGKLIDGGLTESVEYDGPVEHNGIVTTPITRWPTHITKDAGMHCLVGLPTTFDDPFLPNIYERTGGTARLPVIGDPNGGAVVNSDASDTYTGTAKSLTFNTTIGDVSTHRVLLYGFHATVPAIGDRIIYSLLIKSTSSSALLQVFQANAGSGNAEIEVGTDWVRVFLAVKVTIAAGPVLYLYPKDTQGATFFVARFHTALVTSDRQWQSVASRLLAGAFNPKE